MRGARSQPPLASAAPVQLLDLPAKATRLLCRVRRVLSQVVRHDVIRAVGGDRDPETLHLVLSGKTLDLELLAAREFRL